MCQLVAHVAKWKTNVKIQLTQINCLATSRKRSLLQRSDNARSKRNILINQLMRPQSTWLILQVLKFYLQGPGRERGGRTLSRDARAAFLRVTCCCDHHSSTKCQEQIKHFVILCWRCLMTKILWNTQCHKEDLNLVPEKNPSRSVHLSWLGACVYCSVQDMRNRSFVPVTKKKSVV